MSTNTYSITYLRIYLPTYLPTYRPTYLSIYIDTYLHTYIRTYECIFPYTRRVATYVRWRSQKNSCTRCIMLYFFSGGLTRDLTQGLG